MYTNPKICWVHNDYITILSNVPLWQTSLQTFYYIILNIQTAMINLNFHFNFRGILTIPWVFHIPHFFVTVDTSTHVPFPNFVSYIIQQYLCMYFCLNSCNTHFCGTGMIEWRGCLHIKYHRTNSNNWKLKRRQEILFFGFRHHILYITSILRDLFSRKFANCFQREFKYLANMYSGLI